MNNVKQFPLHGKIGALRNLLETEMTRMDDMYECLEEAYEALNTMEESVDTIEACYDDILEEYRKLLGSKEVEPRYLDYSIKHTPMQVEIDFELEV